MHNQSRLAPSLVIPVYGSEKVLPELVSRLQATLDQIDRVRNSYEVIFVCDCSPDDSWHVIQTLSSKYRWVRGILRHPFKGREFLFIFNVLRTMI